jgi:flagellar protein FlaG
MDIQISNAVPAANNQMPQQGSGIEFNRSSQATSTTADAQRSDVHNKKAPESRQASANEVEKATDQVNKFVSSVNNGIQFSIDKETGISVVKVIDKSTNEIIRQIPGDEILQIAKTLDRLQGLFVKQQA